MPAPHSPSTRLGAADPPLPACDPKDLATYRELLDARGYLRQIAVGTLTGADRVTVGGNAAAPTLDVAGVESAAVCDANGVWWGVGASATVTPGALAASTIHYLFLAVSTSGVASFVVTTTPPSSGSYRGTGSQKQRFLAAFATGLLGFPLPAVVRERSGRYVASSGRAEIVVLAPGPTVGGVGGIGRATAWTAVSLATLVPPWATTAWVMAKVSRAAADTAVELRVRRSSADGGHLVAAQAYPIGAADGGDAKLVQVPLLSQGFEYQLNAALTDDPTYGATFTVVGWD